MTAIINSEYTILFLSALDSQEDIKSTKFQWTEENKPENL